MKDSKKKPLIFIIYGPPGSGKGTQARKLIQRFNLEHFDTGRVLEEIVHDPARQDDPIVQRERKNFDTGMLCTPEWVAQITIESIRKFHAKNKGVVFSGAARTLPEIKKIIDLLEDLYGRKNIYVIEIVVKPETSIFRNSHRRVCKKCGFPLIHTPENEKLKKCPKCGGELYGRYLDKPEIIKVRIKEYQDRTKPVNEFLEKRGIKVHKIDGEPLPDQVFKDILKAIK